jgi:pimeloyl-ACP methyl ester carboxylesterase
MSETKNFNPISGYKDLMEYLVDAGQRTVLYWDVMRQRGNQYEEHMAEKVPNVLEFEYEVILSGLTLPQPVNYGIVKIHPPQGTAIDDSKRPFVVFDPRAGHGPGIGGFKAESEIGEALRAGHPCYFVGFSPVPEPGQTIEAVIEAWAVFIGRVTELHAQAEGKPVVIGNCQAGWALMMLAAKYPELCGPIIVAGSPLSYWGGVHGIYPMRYSGGLLGGSWLTALASDMGNGKFDGASLVQNMENLNPANTLWTKQYNLYANIDTEGPRYLGFERWWGGHVLLTGEEIQYIVDNLFVGNKLSNSELQTADGVRLDLRKIPSPIICLCSKGDNITPPQQALGWILDLYRNDADIIAAGQTIVYAIHETIGHL